MGDYPPNEIVDMIRQVGRAEDNYSLAARFYAEKYPNKRHPNRKTIKRLCTRTESGSLKRERRKSGAGEVKSTVIVAAGIVDPHISTREIEKHHGIPKSTANRILQAHKFHPYHIHMLQKLE